MCRKQEAETIPHLKDFVNKNVDCLVMGSSYDIVGHFMLRLLIIYSSQMRDFLIESEIDLFKERLSEKMDISNFIKSCRITLRHIQEVLGMSNIENSNSNQSLELNRRRLSSKNSITIGKQQSHTKKSLCQDSFLMYLMSLKLFCKSLRIPQIAEHFLHGCNHKCRSYHINVQFQTCLNLVGRRKVHMNKGIAKIFCCNWKEALHEIYEHFLLHNIEKLISNPYTSNYIQDDLRVILLFKEIKYTYIRFRSLDSFVENDHSLEQIKFDQVDKESEYFPPCISNVHKILKKIHRLKHNDRFYYSLFLKSIGMSLNESILFWKEEYSKVSCCNSVCSHSWQKNERKYIYGIRHLYGLEGSRKRYSPPDCHAIQGSMHISNLDHSCPFLYKNQEALIQSLSTQITSDSSQLNSILIYRQTHSPLETCRYYMSRLSGLEGPGFESPTGYYFAMKSLTQEGVEAVTTGHGGKDQEDGS
ncbi:hypothetical protein M8J76_010244 [Diaphorina citri]|nr:hypothetical protein M8J76_010244 [Diaphorina citri]KAI5736025.1 hypothetical protein M8J77_025610 [Diaphorina citri]